MKIICSASKDTYITNKIINNRLVADDANVGRAGTLDLFRLYSETLLRGSGSQDEVSRFLIKFDLSPIKDLTGSILDLNSSNFSAKLKLFNIRTGHAVPSNFNIILFPLSQSFDEGVGRDISSFGDLDAANFLTRSYSGGAANLWHASGANASGQLGESAIDIIASGNLGDGSGVVNLFQSQLFKVGTEDLELDVTTIVSSTLAGILPDLGFRLSFSGTEEADSKSRFVKRFASRHVANPHIRPKIEVSFDDSIQDNHGNFLFDVSGSLFLQNYARSDRKNIVSGSDLQEVVGTDCIKLKLKKGDYEYVTLASHHKQGTGRNNVKGMYSASFAIPSNESSLYNKTKTLASLISDSKEVVFDEYWYSTDGTVGFHTGSVTVKVQDRDTDNLINFDPEIYTLNVKSEYDQKDIEKVRLFGLDHSKTINRPVKRSIRRNSDLFDKVFYRVKDRDSGKVIFDFGEADNSTRVSTDKQGMFFDFRFIPLPKGRSYIFEFLIVYRELRLIAEDTKSIFKVT